jgi:glycosyltransferase involved in cell wall biosynthesis
VIASHVDDAELKRLQNRCAFHVCPSEAEGWGYYLVEALSVGAATITVDAPPMNELVTVERGILVPYGQTRRQWLAERYLFDERALATSVEHALAMTPEEISARGTAARRWFLQNKAGFPGRVKRALTDLNGLAPSQP